MSPTASENPFGLPPSLARSAPVVVIGMHRSGTSLLSRILDDLGLHMGHELDIHHEAVVMKEINRALLARSGAHWAKPDRFLVALRDEAFVAQCRALVLESLHRSVSRFEGTQPFLAWGFKDPRNTVTLPIWLQCFPEAKVIHIVRNGFDVARSMFRRETRRWMRPSTEKRLWPPTLGACFRLWQLYVETAEAHVRSHPRCLSLHYEDLLRDGERELERLSRFVGLGLGRDSIARVAQTRIGRPTPPSASAAAWLGFLIKIGRLPTQPMGRLGYLP